MTYAHTVSFCPECFYRMDSAECIHGDGKPKSGDASICLNCGELLIFKPDLSLRRTTWLERSAMEQSPKQWQKIRKAQQLIAQRGRIR
jgi:hypothetical protein